MNLQQKWKAALTKKVEIQDLEKVRQELREDAREIRSKQQTIANDITVARQELWDMLK